MSCRYYSVSTVELKTFPLRSKLRGFVSRDVISEALLRRDSRILYGRRGTGKTHILSFVSDRMRDHGDIVISLDLRTIGSNNSIYSDTSISVASRATHLIRDLTAALSESIEDVYTRGHPALCDPKIGDEISKLAQSVRELLVVETVEEKDTSASSIDKGGSVRVDGKAGLLDLSVTGSGEGRVDTGSQNSRERVVRGVPKSSIRIGSIFGALSSIAKSTDRRIWILLDEWSTVPEVLQPFLADVIRRAFLPIQNVTVQIAAIEHRSNFRIDEGENRIGFELGSDISSDVNLDDFFVYDLNPQPAVAFFQRLGI